MYKAILFDFDGTTLDTETPECASWQEIYTHHGIEFPIDAFHAAVGKGYDQTVFEPAFFLSEALGASDLYEEIRAQEKAKAVGTSAAPARDTAIRLNRSDRMGCMERFSG